MNPWKLKNTITTRIARCRIRQAASLQYYAISNITIPYLYTVKRIVAIFLCACVLIQCMAHWAVVGLFKLNQDYIAKNLCENRSKPQKKCCGKCYLRKQMKKVNGNENGSSKGQTIKIEKNEVFCLMPDNLSVTIKMFPITLSVYNPILKDFLITPFSSSLFHPPSFC